jgi:DCN1-like protein 1/2
MVGQYKVSQYLWISRSLSTFSQPDTITTICTWHAHSVSRYFNNSSSSPASSSSRAALSKLFDQYRDDPKSSPDNITVDGTMNYLQALNVGLEDISSFIVSELIQCPTMGEITRDGFVNGWTEAGGDTIAKQQAIIKQRRVMLGQNTPPARELFKRVYKHTFRLGIQGQGQRSVDKEMCIEMWKMMFSPPSFDWRSKNTDWLPLWIEFVGNNSVKGINADVWNQTLAFAEESVKDESLSWWSEEASWPALVDEFVEFMNEKRGVRQGAEDEEMEY